MLSTEKIGPEIVEKKNNSSILETKKVIGNLVMDILFLGLLLFPLFPFTQIKMRIRIIINYQLLCTY